MNHRKITQILESQRRSLLFIKKSLDSLSELMYFEFRIHSEFQLDPKQEL
jgi:hypothetical protein